MFFVSILKWSNKGVNHVIVTNEERYKTRRSATILQATVRVWMDSGGGSVTSVRQVRGVTRLKDVCVSWSKHSWKYCTRSRVLDNAIACECSVENSVSKKCDRKSGKCICKQGITGVNCDQCKRNTKGKVPNCEPCGECYNNWVNIIEDLHGSFFEWFFLPSTRKEIKNSLKTNSKD